MSAERERARQVHRQHVYAVAVVNALIAAEDPDLWLRAQQLAEDAVFAARAKRRNGTEPHRETPPGEDIPP